jgi:hypothetical protein
MSSLAPYKYAWDIELKRNFPEISKEEFDNVLEEMCDKFKSE